MSIKKLLVLLPLVALAAAACNKTASTGQETTGGSSITSNDNSGNTQESNTPTTLTVNLGEQNNSQETGTATLTEDNGSTTVVLNLTGAPKGVAQPAHIHTGSCANLGDVKYPLNTPTDGTSSTVLDGTTIADLLASPMAINVHKSTTEVNTYIACGDITNS